MPSIHGVSRAVSNFRLSQEMLGNVTVLAFSPDGKILANGSGDGSVQLWDASTYRPIGDARIGHVGRVNELTFSPDSGTLL